MLIIRCYKVLSGITISVDHYPPPQTPGNPDRSPVVVIQQVFDEEQADTPVRLATCILQTLTASTEDRREQLISYLED